MSGRAHRVSVLAMVALVLALALSACGAPANAANAGAPASNSTSKPVNTQPQQYQPAHPGSTTQNSSNSATNTDQQIQSLLRQLDGAHNDVNNADAGASQDGAQP